MMEYMHKGFVAFFIKCEHCLVADCGPDRAYKRDRDALCTFQCLNGKL